MPENGAPGTMVGVVVGWTDVGLGFVVVVVLVVKLLGEEGAVELEGMFLGRYRMPVAGQVDFVPSVFAFSFYSIGWNVVVGRKRLTWIYGHELPGLYAAGNVVMVPDLIQGAVAAADGYWMAAGCGEGGLDLGGGVGLIIRREDAGSCEELCNCVSQAMWVLCNDRRT